MIKDMIFGTVGGLGLFLFGMSIMSDALKKLAGQKLKTLLESLTKHRIIAVLVGASVTAMIQSSSATTVMTVGFVNAGLLTLKQALCVVLGANVGTTFTAWIVSIFGTGLKITAYSMPAVGVGVIFRIAGKTQKTKSIGNVLLGFGLLFIGTAFMKDAFGPLKGSEAVQSVLIHLGQNPILAVLAGTVITVLLQSSSASIMMVQVLAFQGAFGTDWDMALRVVIPFILGDNIGTTITAQLAAIQTSRNAKRTAMGHTLFNVIGVIYMLPLVWTGAFGRFVAWVTPFELAQNTIMVHIAVAHSMFNIFNTIVFLPMITWLEALVLKILPVREQELLAKPAVLERHLLHTPVIAIKQTNREIVRMSKAAKRAVEGAIAGMLGRDRSMLDAVMETENQIDEFQFEITTYLSALSQEQLSEHLSIELPVLLHTVNDLERIGDHAVNIVEIAERMIEQKIVFSASALDEANSLKNEVEQMLDSIVTALEKNEVTAAGKALVNEKTINKMQIDYRRSHVRRMTEEGCAPEAGLIFIDLVDNVEKIGDHLTNIAQAVIGGLQWDKLDGNSLSGEFDAMEL